MTRVDLITQPFDLHGMTFTKSGKPILYEEILAFKKEHKLVFLPEYR